MFARKLLDSQWVAGNGLFGGESVTIWALPEDYFYLAGRKDDIEALIDQVTRGTYLSCEVLSVMRPVPEAEDNWKSLLSEFLSDDTQMDTIFDEAIESDDYTNIVSRVKHACDRFRDVSSTLDDKRDAVRELADVLEFLRDEDKVHLVSKDEAALFELANKYAIRHHRQDQRPNYPKDIWIPWMFYFFLATVLAWMRLIRREEQGSE